MRKNEIHLASDPSISDVILDSPVASCSAVPRALLRKIFNSC